VTVTGSDILATLGAEHADADPACDADHADTDDGCDADHAHPHASQPVDGHAGTTAVKRSLRTCRLHPKVVCDADSEPEDSTPETGCKKVGRLTEHGSPRTQPRTNGF
jgi:hypothetical protein